MQDKLTRSDIGRLFKALDEELKQQSIIGELHVVGGAVMCLVLRSRPATQDVDALFAPTKAVREAAAKVGSDLNAPKNWLNDGVKGFLSENNDFEPYLELDNLRVYTARPGYLLAMKALSMRIGEEFHDESDVRYLLRHLNIETYPEALQVITRYYEPERFPAKTRYALEGIFNEDSNE
jgi:hypothetical protein